jgi:pyruvate ferredoxin oxidoreductase gamma subunit
VLTLSLPAAEGAEERFLGAACAGAAARCVGAIPRAGLEVAIRGEVFAMGRAAVDASLERALFAFDRLEGRAGCVRPGAAPATASPAPPEWIELPFDDARVSAPHSHAAGTSVSARTGFLRTRRPELDRARCHHCHWICSTFCPDGVIAADADGTPAIDFEHCKGCLVCVAVCPHHALDVVPERGGEVAA